MKKFMKIISSASLYSFLAISMLNASEKGIPSQEDGIVYFTSSEKTKLKTLFEKDSADRTAKLEQAKALLNKLVNAKKPDDKQIKAMNTNISNLTARIATNTKITDEMIKTGKYSYEAVVKQLQVLGKTPQDVLKASGIRGNFFAGERFAKKTIEALLLKIDALNPNTSQADLEQAFRRYTMSAKNTDTGKKIDFICETINTLVNEYEKKDYLASSLAESAIKDPFPQTLLKNAVNILEQWLNTFSKQSVGGQRRQSINDAYVKIKQLRTDAKLPNLL